MTRAQASARLDRIVNAIEVTAACFLAAVAALTFVSVILRYLFTWAIPDTYDISRLLLAILIFWGMAGAGYRGGNGRLMYQTRLSELSRDPTGVVRLFVDACRDLRVFYAVSGMSLFFYSYAAGATEKAYRPVIRPICFYPASIMAQAVLPRC